MSISPNILFLCPFPQYIVFVISPKYCIYLLFSRLSQGNFQGCSEPMNDAALQFKLSKKVAELTLVVHMLFTRNHEREVGNLQ